MNRRRGLPLILCLLLAACSTPKRAEDKTIKSLEGRTAVIERDQTVPGGRDKAIEGYRSFLNTGAAASLRAEALRRLADLEMERAEERQLKQIDAMAPEPAVGAASAQSALAAKDYRRIVTLYQDMLRAYPNYVGNDRVLYQLAKAYEYLGDLPQALQVLDRLVATYPASTHRGEVQFRRGELLFVMKSYEAAESAYRAVVQEGDASPFYEKALYKLGWTRFKQARYETGLDAFFVLLDRKLAGTDDANLSAETPNLNRAEKELLEDSFRVVSLSFSYLEGTESIAHYFAKAGRRHYEFRVYRQLGDLYLKQERIKDAADTYNAFVRHSPNHPQAPMFQLRVVEAYQQGHFAGLVLDAKKEFVTRYGVDSEYRRQHAGVYVQVLPHLRSSLEDLARHYHASAQKTKNPDDYREAVTWYRRFLQSFPQDPQTPAMNFLLADLLFESKRYGEASKEYEVTAYDYPRHGKSADAGYAALLAYAEQEKLLKGAEKSTWQQQALATALRFAEANPQDSRTPAVLTKAAEKLYALHAPERAATVAQRVLALNPEADAGLRRTAWTVVAHTEFDQGSFAKAETAYRQVLTLTPAGAAGRGDLVERLASSVYKQGEQSRATGDLRAAVAHFQRVGSTAPGSSIRTTAEYDAAAGLVALKDWTGATKTLETFRRDHPGHPLQTEIADKLAIAYVESEQWAKAAVEFETLGMNKKDPQVKRAALWQAAELYDKAGQDKQAAGVYERYVKLFPTPVEPAVEGRSRLANIYRKQGKTKEQHYWLSEIVKLEQSSGRERTDRTRYLAATAALTVAEPFYEAYRKVRLVEPLKKSLKNKKQKMEQVLKAYSLAAEYGVSEVTTRSTYQIAEIYSDFSRELLASQRPKGLKGDELEQYNVLLEEQSYPFEEKAIEVHEVNAQRAAQGVYDEWVKHSYAALGKLRPVRYAKTEKSEGIVDALR